MTPDTVTPGSAAPSMPGRGGLLLRTAAAAVVATFIVFCVVLPAEYRKDPTGFGRLTGLLELSTPHVVKQEVVKQEAPAVGAESGAAAASNSSAPSAQNTWSFSTPFKTDTIQIPIGPDGEVEYKFTMKAGEAFVYSWQSDSGNVYYDFHGEPAGNPKASQTYKKDEELRSANGAFVAPFDGIHGWYWLNLEGHPIKITLKISGFYEAHDYVK
jgi:hypothetical protein